MEASREYNTVDELRAELRAEALARGTTLEAEMDELERLTHSKGYADCFRQLYGIPLTPEEAEIVSALRNPETCERLIATKEGAVANE